MLGAGAGLLWALLALLLSAEQRLDLATRAVEEGLRGAHAAHSGLLTKILARCCSARGEVTVLESCRDAAHRSS